MSTPRESSGGLKAADNKIDRYFLLSDEEARETLGNNYTEFWDDLRGGYLGG